MVSELPDGVWARRNPDGSVSFIPPDPRNADRQQAESAGGAGERVSVAEWVALAAAPRRAVG